MKETNDISPEVRQSIPKYDEENYTGIPENLIGQKLPITEGLPKAFIGDVVCVVLHSGQRVQAKVTQFTHTLYNGVTVPYLEYEDGYIDYFERWDWNYVFILNNHVKKLPFLTSRSNHSNKKGKDPHDDRRRVKRVLSRARGSSCNNFPKEVYKKMNYYGYEA